MGRGSYPAVVNFEGSLGACVVSWSWASSTQSAAQTSSISTTTSEMNVQSFSPATPVTHSSFVRAGDAEPSNSPVSCCTRDGTVLEGRTNETRSMLRDFLDRLGYQDPQTPLNPRLRNEAADDIESWGVGLSKQIIEGLVDTACSIAESAYAHLPYEHQLFIALYTAHFVYVDDLGNRDLESLGQFHRRYATREDMPDPVLGRIVQQFRDMYRLYPRLSADAIIAGSLETLIGMYIEYATKNVPAVPGATMYAPFLRQKTADGLAYAFFNFVKGWRDPSDTYHLHVMPALDRLTQTINDILSFYKEIVRGENDTYIGLQAAAAKKDPHVVLREVIEETFTLIRMVEDLTANDAELAAICKSYVMGYVEFHVRAGRYCLGEILA
ncbi:terpenoid synthase [Cubamyces sp. BRFM 1775]|nr:terpenoid synthase [Cubamyces sp. BRFM 1775]